MTYSQAIKIFNYSGRKTLRTIFDYLSNEWNNTLLSEKETLLKDLISEKQTLSFFLEEYINLYTKELYNKDYVIFAIPKSLEIIYRNSKDEYFKTMLKIQYLYFIENSIIHKQFKLQTPSFIKK